MAKITRIIPRKIYDSNGNPALEVEICLENGIMSRASAPKALPKTGCKTPGHAKDSNSKIASKKKELVDLYEEWIVNGIKKIKDIFIPEIISINDINDQPKIDDKLSSLNRDSNGFNPEINITFALSLAIARVIAKNRGISLYKYIGDLSGKEGHFELPIPMFNIFDGGLFANNNLDLQSVMIIPIGAKSLKESIRMGVEVFQTTKKLLQGKGYNTSIGKMGGYATLFCLNKDDMDWKSIILEAFELVINGINLSGCKPGMEILLAMDVSADNLYNENRNYTLTTGKCDRPEISRDELLGFYNDLAKRYPISYIENGFAGDDLEGWKAILKSLGNKTMITGNYSFLRTKMGSGGRFEASTANSILVALDQLNTLCEFLDIMKIAKKQGFKRVISTGSGETEDPAVADIAVGSGAELVKFGGPCRTDCVSKYNQLLRIEEELHRVALFKPSGIFR